MAGATGLVGTQLLALLLADKRYAAVHCVGRRAPSVRHAKLHAHSVNLSAFDAPEQLAKLGLPPLDDVYIALGTTIKVAGSHAAFRAVDFYAVTATARAGRAWGASNLGVVSAMGANAASRIFYNRVKGEMEAELLQLGYAHSVIARPSFIEGHRAALGQAGRSGEGLALVAMRFLKPLLPANYRSVAATQVARALHAQVPSGNVGVQLMLSGALHKY